MSLFRAVAADPPWSFGDKLPGASRGAEKNYGVLSVDQICAFPDFHSLPIADDAVLFLWRVASQVEEAYKVVRAWGFVPKTELVWQKLTKSGKQHFGMGHYLRATHETCIVATRGKPKVKVKNIRTTFEFDAVAGEFEPYYEHVEMATVFDAQTGIHSQKPDRFYEIVEQLCDGPYVELFGRRLRPGWTVLGNEVPAEPAEVGWALG